MHLVTFRNDAVERVGVLDSSREEVVDITAVDASLPRQMLALIATAATVLDRARSIVASGQGRLPLAVTELLAPIPQPARNIICVGKNYREHVREVQSLGAADANNNADGTPVEPIFFTKATTSVIGPGTPIPIWLDPTASSDYEGELGVIIGKPGRSIARTVAMQHVFGYTIINDVTSRRLQKRHQQWFLGKSLDGYCPMGPAILTADAVADTGTLIIQTRVNGELRQQAAVAQMIFDIPLLIETLSRGMTLLPGDIIATGTPAGVGMGFTPPRFLKTGDQVAVTIEPIGTLRNPVM